MSITYHTAEGGAKVGDKRMPKILIIGLCAVDEPYFELQLGNVAIFTATIKMLKDRIPNAQISTNFQLSENFCKKNEITSIKHKAVWSFSPRYFLKSLINLSRCILWRLFQKLFGINVAGLINERKLKEYLNADIILDFSGDLYSDDFNYIRAMKHSIDILAAIHLGKPVIIFAQSSGPFRTRLTSSLAKFVLNRTTLIINREGVSKDYLHQIGVVKPPIFATGDPAFLFEPARRERVEEILSIENVNTNDRPLIGLSICEFNLPSSPWRPSSPWKIPWRGGYPVLTRPQYETLAYLAPIVLSVLNRTRWAVGYTPYIESKMIADLKPFVQVIDYLIEELNATVLLIPHVHASTEESDFWSDEGIAKQLYQMTEADKKKKIKVIRGHYSSEEVKGIIGQCDLFISGRMHAAIAALSQNVPTVGMSYGHKFYGIMGMVGQERYICGKNDTNDIISKIQDAWVNRKKITKELESKIPKVKKLSLHNAELVEDILIKQQISKER